MDSRLRRSAAALVAVTSLALTACGGQGSTEVLTVFAAASLTEPLTALAERFEDVHPGVDVVLNFGASSTLGTQLREGADADIFASASTATMDSVADLTAAPTHFASNLLAIAVPPDNPAGISDLADLSEPGTKVALCQPHVPCGALAATVLANAGLTVTPSTLESDVKAVLAKVRLGEVDAGLVYASDVRAAGAAVVGIAIPDDLNAATRYPIARVTASDASAVADEFIAFVLSAEGQCVFTDAGFAPPGDA